MKPDWEQVTVGDIATLQRGFDIPVDERGRGGKVPVISSGGISAWHNEAKVEGLGVLVGRKGTLGSVHWIDGPYWPNSTCLWVKDFHGNEPRFVYYFFKARAAEMLSMDVGAANPTLNRNHVHPLPAIRPPNSEQRAIAQMLGALDDKIELNRRMNATLEAMAEAVFKEWFVDGAKEEWKEKTISDLADINSWTLGKNDKLDVIDYIEISEVNRGDIGKIERYSRGEEPGRAKRRLRNGDTVMSTVRPDRGAYFLSLKPAETLIASSGFAVITPTRAPWSFIHAALTQPEVFDYLGQQADGGAYPAVRPEIIGAYTVAWPNDETVLDRFHEVVAPLYERAAHNRNESRTLAALRDTLLPKLMRGEVRVSTPQHI